MRKIVPFISLGLSIAMILGCGHTDMRVTRQNRTDEKKETVVVAEDRTATYFEQLKKMGKKGNYIYSPESMNTALQMYGYVTEKEENKALVKQLLGETDYLSYKNNKESFRLVNRIWKNKEKTMKIEEAIKPYIYEMDMADSAAATKEKNDFVKQNTNNFINSTPSVLNRDTIYDIMNVTYFKDQWAKGDLKQDASGRIFTNADKSKVKTKYLNYTLGKTYYENNTAKAVKVPYKDGFELLLIRPKKDLASVKMANLLENEKKADVVDVRFPEFSIKSKMDATTYFTNLGLKKESANTDLSITQVARICVDKKGTEAAAVSEIVATTTSIRTEPPKIVKVTLNKPFYYAILDTTNKDVAFVGQVTHLKK